MVVYGARTINNTRFIKNLYKMEDYANGKEVLLPLY